MPHLSLIVMAAGIGSRYGGLKQVDPIGPNGEIVIDYSIYDAVQAGFDHIVFLIRRELEEVFRDKIGGQVEKHVATSYVFQELSNLPAGFAVPAERKKPWGTGQAVLLCKDVIQTPFAAINADDFYGREAFKVLAEHLGQAHDQPGQYDYCMLGYLLSNTLSEHGYVARGVCQLKAQGDLAEIHERTHIEKRPNGIAYSENGQDWVPLPPNAPISMNAWGFTPSIFAELEQRFPVFLRENAANILKAEFFLPEVVGQLLREKRARVKVLPVQEKWYGVTYQEDRPQVQAAIREMVGRGLYPNRLW